MRQEGRRLTVARAPKRQRVFRPVSARTSRDSIAWDAKEDVKKSRQRKGREDGKEESFEKMLCALCDLCVQRDSFTSSKASRSIRFFGLPRHAVRQRPAVDTDLD